MKKLIYILITIVIAAVMAYVLINNKEQMEEEASIAEIKSDAISVQITQPKVGKINRSFFAQGNFAPIQSLTLMSETTGQINRILKRKGDHVNEGDLLIEVEAQTIRAELATIQANYDKAQRDLQRFENLAAGDAITKRQLEDAKLALTNAQSQLTSTKKRLANTQITAPIDGEINEMYVEVGSYLGIATRLYDIVNVDRLKLNVKLSAHEVMRVNKGDEVMIQADLMKSMNLKGKVTAIAAQADNSLKYNVEIEFENPKTNRLRAGMYGTAFFEIEDEQQVVLIPREAIVGSLQNPSVYVVRNEIAHLVKVQTGTVAQDQVEIVDGLNTNDKIVQSGQINLRDGIKVTAI